MQPNFAVLWRKRHQNSEPLWWRWASGACGWQTPNSRHRGAALTHFAAWHSLRKTAKRLLDAHDDVENKPQRFLVRVPSRHLVGEFKNPPWRDRNTQEQGLDQKNGRKILNHVDMADVLSCIVKMHDFEATQAIRQDASDLTFRNPIVTESAGE
jgi:hypothetical protein